MKILSILVLVMFAWMAEARADVGVEATKEAVNSPQYYKLWLSIDNPLPTNKEYGYNVYMQYELTDQNKDLYNFSQLTMYREYKKHYVFQVIATKNMAYINNDETTNFRYGVGFRFNFSGR